MCSIKIYILFFIILFGGISYLNAVGRRPKIRKDAFLDIVERNKEKVITSNKSIVPRTNPIWEIIAKDLDVGVKASTVYAKVGSNTFGALDLLRGVTREYLGNSSSSGMQSNTGKNSQYDDSDVQGESYESSNDSSQEPMDVKFEILMRREEFFKLTKHITYKSTRICKTERSYRRWLVFKPGEWQSIFADKIWENTRFKCAIHFRKHYLALRGDSGSIYGYCRCGSRFHATFENDVECDIIWYCTLRPGPTGKKCGKVYVRKSLRKKIANQLQNEHVDVFRSKKANELMRDGDPEPSILPYSQTLYSLKSLEKQKKYLHTDPILAIDVMKSSQYANVIQCLWYRPFCVHYWTNQQIHIVKKCFSSENFKISINATGGVCHRLHDKHIFLYQIAVNCGQQFTVAQMLSNSHRTNDIQYWLQMWQSAAPFAPKEIVMDCAKALLHASARVFAGFVNIYEYSNAVASQETMPRCYIRLDVAHFIHTYAGYLKGTMSLVRTFWLAIIGHLIMCKSKQQAQQVLKSIFIVAKSPTEGLKTNKDPTSCEAHKKQLETLVTANMAELISPNDEIDENNSENEEKLPSEDENSNIAFSNMNEWVKFCEVLEDETNIVLEERGDRVNAHCHPKLIQKLKADMPLFPLWGNVYRSSFGYGRIPATSAESESEFNKIKNVLLRKERLRVDDFLQKHVEYLQGKLKLVEAAESEGKSQSSEDIEMYESDADFEMTNNISTMNVSSENISMSNTENSQTKQCPACKNGDEPSGAHTCVSCFEAVHAIEPCSYACGEEGYGQKRVCYICYKANTCANVLASRCEENWRGLGAQKQPTGFYLGSKKEQVKSALMWKNHANLPILKNGSDPTLQPIQVNGNNVSVMNTCAFDSICQVILAACSDNNALLEKLILTDGADSFFKFINDIIHKGITSSTYKKRAIILSKFCEILSCHKDINLSALNCEVTVTWLAQQLFKECPSIKESTKCTKGCVRETSIAVKIVSSMAWKSKSAAMDMSRECAPFVRERCGSKNCSGVPRTILEEIGPIFLVDISSDFESREQVPIKSLPQEMTNPRNDEKTMILIGFISFRGSYLRRSNDLVNAQSVGHYTGLAKRGNAWYEYDDLKGKPQIRKETYRISPHLLMFSNV